MSMSDDDFEVECSDEEIKNEFTKGMTGWEPSGPEILRLYEAIARDGTLPIAWKWEHGRRPLTPLSQDSDSEKEEKEDDKVDTSGFDFDDEPAAPKMTPRRTPGTGTLKGSAKKKTPSFENILASVRRQQKQEAKEKHKSRKEKR
ncbi:PAXIP1-associated glutamate-rich protein 1-like [Oratosquilla oratoria]|uniref:PAXIP1-associated glutamate-rich protein 1-like n=1 Tax=Oratosquilla oratoria TaxID=337810 RepID=UPI003F77489D